MSVSNGLFTVTLNNGGEFSASAFNGEARCPSLFEAASAKWVQEVNELAQIPFTRIVEALDLTS